MNAAEPEEKRWEVTVKEVQKVVYIVAATSKEDAKAKWAAGNTEGYVVIDTHADRVISIKESR